ncbi:MAG: hypothetical protein H6581_04875 [Bacteroidia bacterium]|nr:hypothetical protein [Bacteroidia bacterium]
MKLKSIFVFATFALLFYLGNAQTLEFNQVVQLTKTYYNTSSPSYKQDNLPVTVPAGKVWKITAAWASYSYPSGLYRVYVNSSGTKIILDDAVISIAGTSNSLPSQFPIWLPAGAHTFTLQTDDYGVDYRWTMNVSVIEFNVVP